MNIITRLSFILFPITALLTFAVLALSRAGHGAPIPSLDERLLPGASFDWRDAICQSYSGTGYYSYTCQTTQADGRRVSFSYRSNVIESVSISLWNENVSIGSLMLAWGTPLGRCGARFHWAGRDAYVYERDLTPDSPVSFVVWGNTRAAPDWRGFRRWR